MKAAIFECPGRIVLADKPIPEVGSLDMLLRVTTTTLCGTDVHILKGEYLVAAMVTHRFELADIEDAYELFSHRRDGVLKVAIRP